MDRFIVEEKSVSGHCCFAFSVMDTDKDDNEPVCECYEREDAKKICDALNSD